MYVVLNIITVKPEHLEEFTSAVRRHAAASNAEPGCVRYDVLQDTSDPNIISLYEVFVDEAAFRQHREYDHYKAWMECSKDWRDDEKRIRHVLDYVVRAEESGTVT